MTAAVYGKRCQAFSRTNARTPDSDIDVPSPEWRRPAHGSRTDERSAVFQYALPTSRPASSRSRPLAVAREHRRAEPELGVVHARDRVGVVAHARDADHRPEALVAHERCGRRDVDHDGRREPVAGPVDAVAAAQHLAAALRPRRRAARRARRAARRARAARCRSRRRSGSPTRYAPTTSTSALDERRPRSPRARTRARSRCTTARRCRTRPRRSRARPRRCRRRRTRTPASLPPSSSCTRTRRSAAARGDACGRSRTSR